MTPDLWGQKRRHDGDAAEGSVCPPVFREEPQLVPMGRPQPRLAGFRPSTTRAGRKRRPAAAAAACRVSRRRHRGQSDRGQSMVEFALMAPLVLFLFIGVIVAGIFALNYVQLANAVRDGARAAAVCGGAGRGAANGALTPTLPDGSACTDTNLINYVKDRFAAIDKNLANLNVTLPTGGGGDHLSQCQYGKTVELKVTYDQPFYIPGVGKVLSNNGSGSTFTITAQAEATCEV